MPMYKQIKLISVFLTCLSICAHNLYSQSSKRELFLTAGINLSSIGWSPSHLAGESSTHYSRTVNFGAGVLSNNSGKKRLSIIANTGIGVHAGFMWKDKKRNNLNGLQLEFQSNKACYSFNPPFKYGYRGDTAAMWVDADNYLKYSLSLMRTWYLFSRYKNDNDFWYTKLSFGQTFHHTNFGSRYELNQEEDWTENGTGMKSKVVSFNDISYMISPEIGHKFLLANDNILDIGIVYHQPFKNTRLMEYEFFKHGASLGKSQITYTGATIMLNVSYTFVHKIKRKPIDTTKTENLNLIVSDSTGGPNQNTSFHHHKINGRHYKIQESITVHSPTVTLSVWDKNRIDGDEISLYLNGELILEEYVVSKTKKEIVVNLQPGSNIIVMQALNLGRIPPNTAAISIDDGVKKKIVTLVSDLKQSGALEIMYQP